MAGQGEMQRRGHGNGFDFANRSRRANFRPIRCSFATFEPAVNADLFATQADPLRRDGSLVSLKRREDVIRYYRAATRGYHRNGCRSCRWADLQVTDSGSQSMLAAVTWDLLHEDGSFVAELAAVLLHE